MSFCPLLLYSLKLLFWLAHGFLPVADVPWRNMDYRFTQPSSNLTGIKHMGLKVVCVPASGAEDEAVCRDATAVHARDQG